MNEPDKTLPAFPVENNFFSRGMTLRDYFAAKAIQALISLPDRDVTAGEDAKAAYIYADAMLSERAKKTESAK